MDPSMLKDQDYRGAIEALLFVSQTPLEISQICRILNTETELVKKNLELIQDKLSKEKCGFQLFMIDGGYLLQTDERWASLVEKLPGVIQLEKISLAGCEVLALLANQGAMTRMEIERARGVDSSGPVSALCEKGLIESHVKTTAAGQPIEYRLSPSFYTRFGLSERKDLEKLYEKRFLA